MTSSRFTETTRELGLHKTGVGLTSAVDLAKLIESGGVPMIRRTDYEKRSNTPSPLSGVRALIRVGLAKLDGDHYRATPEGREWLAKIREHNLLPIPETTSLHS